jgi:hypothetical protein
MRLSIWPKAIMTPAAITVVSTAPRMGSFTPQRDFHATAMTLRAITRKRRDWGRRVPW